MTKCPYCSNGTIYVESGCSLGYRCPDCEGTGYILEEGIDYWICQECGERMDQEQDLCDACQEQLELGDEENDEIEPEISVPQI